MNTPRFHPEDGKPPASGENLDFLKPDGLDDLILHLPCFEPAGFAIELSLGDALRHLLIVGQTGSGKTTLNNRILQDLISYRRSTTNQPVGLLILDAQGDDTVQRIRQMAAKAGRLQDVRVLSPSEGFFDPIGELQSFDDLDLVVSKLISASETAEALQGDNAYWSENTRLLLECGLAILLLTESKITLHSALSFLSGLLVQGNKWPAEVTARVEHFKRLVTESQDLLSFGIQAKLTLVRSTLINWQNLDYKTRGILQTCVAVVLAPFLSSQALPYWDERKGGEVFPSDALGGKIIILSVRGSSEPETAALLSRLVKIDFYRAAQSRRNAASGPVAGLILDEFPLCVTTGSARWSDITNLATLRGKGVFVVAATQGLANLDLIITSAHTQALLINFSNLVFLRSQEIGHLYALAEKVLGFKPAPKIPGLIAEIGQHLLMTPPGVQPRPEPVCPEGSLARLEPHQAFIALANGYRSLEPVWLAPLYFESSPIPVRTKKDRDLAILRAADQKIKVPAPESLYLLAEACSLQLYHVLLAHQRRGRAAQIMTAREFHTGLSSRGHLVTLENVETIPPCWRKACLCLATKLPAGFRIAHLICEDGRLRAIFFATFPSEEDHFSEFYLIERRWQLSVYPSRVRAASRNDMKWLEKQFPTLAAECRLRRQNRHTKKSIQTTSTTPKHL